MMLLVFFLLCSGLKLNRLRVFNVLGYRERWRTALNKCKTEGGSLVTLYDDEDATFMRKYAVKALLYSDVWLGLTKSRKNVTTWSNGEPYTFSHSSVSTTNINNGDQKCEAMDKNTWKGFSCSVKHSFMCYKDNKYVLIEKKKNWCQAEQYCREKYDSHLVSISNEEQNQEVITEGKNKTFWIGLLHDEWEWVDQTCSTYRTFSDPPEPNHCYTAQQTANEPIPMKTCRSNHEAKVLCSKGDMRIRVIKESKTWEEALEYCEKYHTSLLWMKDDDDQKAVEQWLDVNNEAGTFWIGLRQSVMFGFWIWKDRPVSVSNWKNNQPPELPFSQHCGVLKTTDNYEWSDENCFYKHRFICEEKILKN